MTVLEGVVLTSVVELFPGRRPAALPHGLGTFFDAGIRYCRRRVQIYMWLELLTLIIGIAFGFFHKGKEDYWGILRNGAVLGIVIGVLAVLISLFLAPGSTSLSFDFPGAFGTILVILVFVILMIAGTFVGDRIERVLRK